jgi:N-acetyl-anhydromuramyl-L-alanine amidase AmpD
MKSEEVISLESRQKKIVGYSFGAGFLVLLFSMLFGGGKLAIAKTLTPHKFKTGRPEPIKQIIIHVSGSDAVAGGAQQLAEDLASLNWTRDASWHYAVDNGQIVQSVLDADEAYHAMNVNPWSIGIELIGHERTNWSDSYSLAQLALAAKLVAALCKKYKIPKKFVTAAQLKNDLKTPGITGHVHVWQALGKTDRSDPGVSFPWDSFIKQVQAD